MSNKPNLQYIPGKRGGYDATSRRYRTADGAIVPKSQFHNLSAETNFVADDYGFAFNRNTHPESDAYSYLERVVAGVGEANAPRELGDRFSKLLGMVDPDRMPAGANAEPIPSQIRAAYNLVDFYFDSEGDVAQFVEAPIDVALNPLNIQGEWKSELEAYYAADSLNMDQILFEIMYSTSKYGVAYPFEVWDGDRPVKIVLLPPRYMWVGYHATGSAMFDSISKSVDTDDPPYRMRPLDNSRSWTEALMKSVVKPISYGPMADRWNDQVPGGQSWGLPIPMQYLQAVRSKCMSYERYPMPPISRAFRAISTRMGFSEMRRATIEGYRNQLWVFTIGEKDRPPSPTEMAALKAAINGMAGDRTGNLVWRFGLDAKVLVPNAIQGMLANETSMLFTLEIWRALGANVRLATGNSVSITGGGGEGLEVDLSLWLRRLEFIRKQLLNWELGYRLRLAKRVGGASAVKAAKATVVRFSHSLLDVADLIKKELQPLYQAGLISPQSALERAGYNYDVELANKKEFEADREHFMPMPTYSQTSVGSDGTQKTSDTAPAGRPADNANPKKIAGK